ncbi:MAG TPA: plastocyanin/azurin family copper-binding protein [Nitrososphaeraceae archaeon]|nr:plastocyanin/azurin family copper-binding protein [Nitrososphaeraceae archaeon]
MKNQQYRFLTSPSFLMLIAIFLTGTLIAHSITQYQLNIYAQTDNATEMTANQTISNQNFTTTTGSQESDTISVSIVKDAALKGDKAYQPNPITVKVGQELTWTNDDSQIHTSTSGTGPGDAESGNVFDSGILSPGASYSFTFDESGDIPYYCTLHPQMVGTVTVS